jgi:hypothetical protein
MTTPPTFYESAAGWEDLMKLYRAIWLAIGLGLPFVVAPVSAQAAEIRLLCSNGLREVVEALVPQFERASGHKSSNGKSTPARRSTSPCSRRH